MASQIINHNQIKYVYEYSLGWVEKSKVWKNNLGHVDPVEIHKNKHILPYNFD